MSAAFVGPRCVLRLFVGAVAVVAALASAQLAYAGYGMQPNGQTFPTQVDSIGYLTSPATIDFAVYLDSADSSAYVWVSDTPQVGPFGLPAGRTVGSCGQYELIPFGEPNKWVCRETTILMKPGTTYYWWLDFRRQDPGELFPSDRVSGPFSFTLAAAQPAAPPASPPPATTPSAPSVPSAPAAPISLKTVASASRLPSSSQFNGARSIKHVRLSDLVYKTLEQLGSPYMVAVACWDELDWESVVSDMGEQTDDGNGTTLLGFWSPHQPRWLHLAPRVCGDVQGLINSKIPNGRRAASLSTVIHESLHAHRISNEAETNCYAVQLAPLFGRNLGMSVSRSSYLGTLARRYVRGHAPSGYWNYGKCRDGGTWDLLPRTANLGP